MPSKNRVAPKAFHNRQHVPLFKLEVTATKILVNIHKPRRRAVVLFLLVLIPLCLLTIAFLRHDLQSKALEIASYLLQLLLAINQQKDR